MCRGFKSRLRHVFFFFVLFCFFLFFLFIFFLCFFLSLLLQCKFANSTLLSLLSFSNFITPYDAQASSAFSALIFIKPLYYEYMKNNKRKPDTGVHCEYPNHDSFNLWLASKDLL